MSLLSELVGIVSKFSPAVASTLGSPIGGLVLTVLGNIFKTDPSNLDELIKRLREDPEAEYKIKSLEAEITDLQSARNREVSYTNATKQRDWMLPVLSIIVAIGFFMTLFFVVSKNMPAQDKYFMYGLIFGIGVQFAQVYNYYFGRYNSEIMSSLAAPFMKVYNTFFKKP